MRWEWVVEEELIVVGEEGDGTSGGGDGGGDGGE